MPPAPADAGPSKWPLAPAKTGLAWLGRVLLIIAVPLTILLLASALAIAMVRVGGDLRLGIDPFTSSAARPRLPLSEVAGRAVAMDALRQVLMALLVVALAVLASGGAWRRRLGLARPLEARTPMRRLWLLLPLWPLIHIAWVTTTAAALHMNFGNGVRLSPFLSPVMLGLWFAFVVVLAPIAEELLLRGETFARASAFLGPAGTIVATALLFCLAHVSLDPGAKGALARPLTLLPLALTLGWLRWRTGRLWPCILLHGWSNFCLVAYQLGPGLLR
ncbi:abortive infection protein [Methylorubrum populi]|uniref:Abortive infection protein n=1 Tax=Methylorubrum populi TaxID=223967 RepID=A0A160PEH1_9HYPH|nr:CPBP family intramembrane glutamic endopeptidase [Methylorubrum populi]BAU91557.1 abortive infection protein [Methylorubrum populi]